MQLYSCCCNSITAVLWMSFVMSTVPLNHGGVDAEKEESVKQGPRHKREPEDPTRSKGDTGMLQQDQSSHKHVFRQANSADVYKLVGTYFNAECGTNQCDCLIRHAQAGGYDHRRRGIRDCAQQGGSCVPVWMTYTADLLADIDRKLDALVKKLIIDANEG